jgi:opacity protein-like surface antigen
MGILGRQDRMRLPVALLIGTFAVINAAQAQTGTASKPSDKTSKPADKMYIEGFAQTVASNATSQAFGGEFGLTVLPHVQVFAEGARVNNVATAALGASAKAIGGYLAATQANVAYSVQEPVTIVVAGVKFVVPNSSSLRPYVIGGGGMARLTQNVVFTVGGTDVTNNLTPYGVTLGSDLSGSFTKPVLALGGGIVWPVGDQFLVDIQYRYGRIFVPGQGINLSRLGVGLGLRF